MDESELHPSASPIEVNGARDSLQNASLEVEALLARLRKKDEEPLERGERRLHQLRETSTAACGRSGTFSRTD